MMKRKRIFILNDPYALRICGELAQEIGFNESIVLLQLEFLISISDNVREGRRWTYQSTRALQRDFFPWWGVMTINRIIHSLEEKGLIVIDNFNRCAYDKTRWFSLNYENLDKLKSVAIADWVYQNGTGPVSKWYSPYQDGTRLDQNGTRSDQDGTTIPETTPETTPENNTDIVQSRFYITEQGIKVEI